MIIIFDWDGTLCDSVDHIVAAMQGAAAELSLPQPSAAQIRNIVGLGLPESVATLFPGLPGPSARALAETYSQHYRAVGHRQGPSLFAGALATLEGLRERGFELAVATGKSRRGLDRILGELGLANFFDATRCADETRSKPHPQMLDEILETRCKAPQQAVMVGDTEYDLAMAAAAGIRSVGVSFGVHDSERLANHGPLAIIDALPHLLDLPALAGSGAGLAEDVDACLGE